jgi:hypothetical protein
MENSDIGSQVWVKMKRGNGLKKTVMMRSEQGRINEERVIAGI